MVRSEPTPLQLERVRLMDVWGKKRPKLLAEEMRHRWEALEEGEWQHAFVRGWREERSLSRNSSQHDSSKFDKPALRTVTNRFRLTTLGIKPRAASPHSLHRFHSSSDSFSGLYDLGSAFLKLLPDRKTRSRQPAAVGLTFDLTTRAFNL